jgi:protein phosphatase methylesterase 1
VLASQLDVRIYFTPPKVTDGTGTVMVCHHGAGTSGLSFACFAKEVSDMTKGECGILALDARRHGVLSRYSTCLVIDYCVGKTTSTSKAPDSDLSITILTSDLFALLQTLYPDPASAPAFIVRPVTQIATIFLRTLLLTVGGT